MRYIAVSNNKSNAKFHFYIHTEGCGNIRLEAKRFFGIPVSITGADIEDAITNFLNQLGNDFTRNHFMVSPCLK